MTYEERLARAIEFNKRVVASQQASVMSTRNMIRNDEISVDEMDMLVELYPFYEVGRPYLIGDIFQFDGTLYFVLQAHTSQADWTPPTVPALYLNKMPEAVIPGWKQPTGAHDAYKIGNKVIFEGATYESLIDANIWSPTAYPQGWKKL